MSGSKSLVYLDRDCFYYYDSSLSGVLKCEFGAETVADLEVRNTLAVHEKIRAFAESSNLQPAALIIVLSPRVYFEKEFPETVDFRQDYSLSKFVDNVPFENTSVKVYKMATSSLLVAANEDFFMEIKIAFEKLFFTVEAIVPSIVLGIDIILVETLEVETAKKILAKFDLARSNSLLMHREAAEKSPSGEEKKSPSSNNNKTLIYTLPVFLLLLAVLSAVFLKSSEPPPRKKAVPPPAVITVRPTEMPAERQSIATGSGESAAP